MNDKLNYTVLIDREEIDHYVPSFSEQALLEDLMVANITRNEAIYRIANDTSLRLLSKFVIMSNLAEKKTFPERSKAIAQAMIIQSVVVGAIGVLLGYGVGKWGFLFIIFMYLLYEFNHDRQFKQH